MATQHHATGVPSTTFDDVPWNAGGGVGGTNIPRTQVADLAKGPGFAVTSRPVDAYMKPVADTVKLEGVNNDLGDLAQALASMRQPVEQYGAAVHEQQSKEELEAGRQARTKNQTDFRKAIEQGLIKEAQSPWFVRGYMEMDGRASGQQMNAEMWAAYSTSEAKESPDPNAVLKFMSDFQKEWLKKHPDATQDWMRGFEPESRSGQQNLGANHIAHRQAEISAGLRDKAGQVVDTLIKAQQVRETGLDPNDPLVGASRSALGQEINRTMADLVKNGLSWSAANKIIMDQAATAGEAAMDETLTRSILDGIQTPGGALSSTAAAQATITRVERNVLSMKEQQKRIEWANEDRPFNVAARDFGVKERKEREKAWAKAEAEGDKKEKIEALYSRLFVDHLTGKPWHPADLEKLGAMSPQHVKDLLAYRDVALARTERIVTDQSAYATLRNRITDGEAVTEREIWNGVKMGLWDDGRAANAVNDLREMRKVKPLDNDRTFKNLQSGLESAVARDAVGAITGAGAANAPLAGEWFRAEYAEIIKNDKLSEAQKLGAIHEAYGRILKHYNALAADSVKLNKPPTAAEVAREAAEAPAREAAKVAELKSLKEQKAAAEDAMTWPGSRAAATARLAAINGRIRELEGGAAPSPYRTPGPGAINMLKANPGTAADFDRTYGPGAAAKILGGRK